MKDIKKYVFATEDDLNDGCGVLVGDLFVTAGHVVEERPFRTTIDDKKYAFYKKDAILYHWNEAESRDANSIDIAVFKVEGAHSPLTFADFSPAVGDSLRSISLEHKEGEYAHEGDVSLIPEIFKHNTYTYYELNDCKAEVTELEGNYIACNTDVILKPGSSGSPLLCGDKVVGILHSGKVGTNLCAFLSAKVILDELNKNLCLCYTKEKGLHKSFYPIYEGENEKQFGQIVGKYIKLHSKKGYKGTYMSFVDVEGNTIRIEVDSNLGYYRSSYLTAKVYKNDEPIIIFNNDKLNYKYRATLVNLTVNAGYSANLDTAEWQELFNTIIDVYKNNKYGYFGDIQSYVHGMNVYLTSIDKTKAYKDYKNNDGKEITCSGVDAFLFMSEKVADLCSCLNKLGIATYSIFKENGCERVSPVDCTRLQEAINSLTKTYWKKSIKFSRDIRGKESILLLQKAVVRVCQLNPDIKVVDSKIKIDDVFWLAERKFMLNERTQTHVLELVNKFDNNKYIYQPSIGFLTPLNEEGFDQILDNHNTPNAFMVKKKLDPGFSIFPPVSSKDEKIDYIEARGFSHGYASVKADNGKWGIINTSGDTIYPFEYDVIFPIADDPVIRAKKDGKDCTIELLWEETGHNIDTTGITNISCRNFRKLEKIDIALSSVNFIVGKNNAGKSTFLNLIEKTCNLIASVNNETTLPSCYGPLSKEKAEFDYKKDLTWGKQSDDMALSITIGGVNLSFEISERKREDKTISHIIRNFSALHDDVEISYDVDTDEVSVFSNGISSRDPFKDYTLGDDTPNSIWDRLKKAYCYDKDGSRSYPDSILSKSSEEQELWNSGLENPNESAIEYAKDRCNNVCHIPVFCTDHRIFVETIKVYKARLQMLNAFDANNSSRIEAEIKMWMSQWLKDMEIGESITENYEVMKDGHTMEYDEMGTGSKHFYILLLKVCEIMLDNLASRPNYLPVLMIEEPEQNLHPMLQSKLADFFLDVVEMQDKLIEKYRPKVLNRAKLQIIVETHSEYVIRRTQVLVADKNEFERQKSVREGSDNKLPIEGYDTIYDIEEKCPFKVFYFSSKKKPYEMGFNKNGTFIESFEEGFFDESGSRYYQLLDIDEAKERRLNNV